MKLLVVEDELKTGAYLRQGLNEAGFVVDLARDGIEGLHLALTEAYDLAVLDVMLPGADGWQVLQGIRKAGKDMPVLFLTARDHVDDRVKGLELGADDYLTKPFAFSELLARVRTLLRRGGKNEEKGITLTCSGSGVASGDRLMLRRAVSNLLSNAIRHTPAGGRIDVDLDSSASSVTLTVRNPGEIIPAEHLPRIFDRFYRVDASRHSTGEGAGLGLAITRSIVRAHGGDASVKSGNGATTFAMTIPAGLPGASY